MIKWNKSLTFLMNKLKLMEIYKPHQQILKSLIGEAFLMVNELEVTYNTTSKLVTKITSLK